MDKSQINKDFFIEKIKGAEFRAKEMLQLEIEQDFYLVEDNAIDKGHEKELISKILSGYFDGWLKTRNHYKVACDNFHFLNKKANFSLTNDDRVDFVAMMLEALYNQEAETPKEKLQRLELLRQLNSLSSIVYESRLKWLKKEFARKSLQEFQKPKQEEEKLFPYNENYYNKECCDILNYMVENYDYKRGTKFTNLWFFFNEELDKAKHKFHMDKPTFFKKASEIFGRKITSQDRTTNYYSDEVRIKLKKIYKKQLYWTKYPILDPIIPFFDTFF